MSRPLRIVFEPFRIPKTDPRANNSRGIVASRSLVALFGSPVSFVAMRFGRVRDQHWRLPTDPHPLDQPLSPRPILFD